MLYQVSQYRTALTIVPIFLVMGALAVVPAARELFSGSHAYVDLCLWAAVLVFAPRHSNIYGFLAVWAFWRIASFFIVPIAFEFKLVNYLLCVSLCDIAWLKTIQYRLTITHKLASVCPDKLFIKPYLNKAVAEYRLLPQEWLLIWLSKASVIYNLFVIFETWLEYYGVITVYPLYDMFPLVKHTIFFLGAIATWSFVADPEHVKQVLKV
ncbi:hypothetical protein [Ferrimonas aestuarii]|uniref:Uncharacterized protein n=1 Tax=Ferrimonas aestuarii TaxID=2569539 RepID=A0A4U1BU03_9GAMM|nr:hypothetical protein [Ferrimonas aestuarii]TKB58692.1 hypothetical protein FCL42_02795 [Ferrimonas aestuarii]